MWARWTNAVSFVCQLLSKQTLNHQKFWQDKGVWIAGVGRKCIFVTKTMKSKTVATQWSDMYLKTSLKNDVKYNASVEFPLFFHVQSVSELDIIILIIYTIFTLTELPFWHIATKERYNWNSSLENHLFLWCSHSYIFDHM